MMNSLPAAVRGYLADPAADVFTTDAVVVDDGRTYRGPDEIRAWTRRTTTEFRYTATLTGFSQEGAGEWTVVQHLSGDFPGGEVDLRYRFQLRGERIAALTIAP
ncbi:hypothetical protein GCM10017786_61620 [Amycolatopsis deserti]|uniref:SnoaL-like domain-containing protein n=1 Tax=Amycolatopsis deserti TaxID=185696 RepID=A0ABQ3JBS7_9PSEU|nr:nuclear transport factor 2 family protein [Amycolatopsis deserti]GHF19431.1 hypothetical protein GCM10017786_61620 [Amycolatopsis deserti]